LLPSQKGEGQDEGIGITRSSVEANSFALGG
jgi:hypothetical protein